MKGRCSSLQAELEEARDPMQATSRVEYDALVYRTGSQNSAERLQQERPRCDTGNSAIAPSLFASRNQDDSEGGRERPVEHSTASIVIDYFLRQSSVALIERSQEKEPHEDRSNTGSSSVFVTLPSLPEQQHAVDLNFQIMP